MARHRSILLAAPLAPALILVLGAVSVAQTRADLYTGGKPNTVTAAAWGAGKAETSDEQMYKNTSTIKIQTRGFHEGGLLKVTNPVALAPYAQAADRSYVELRVKVIRPEAPVVEAAAPAAGGTTPGMMGPGMMGGGMMGPGMMGPGMMGGSMMGGGMMGPGMMGPGMMGGGMMGPGMMGGMAGAGGAAGGGTTGAPAAGGTVPMGPGMMGPGMMGPGMMGGMMRPGMMGGMNPMGAGGAPAVGLGAAAGGQAQKQTIEQLRVLLLTDKGADIDSGPVGLEEYLIANPAFDDEDGWFRVVVPLKQFKALAARADGNLSGVALFGDAKDSFYVAAVRLIQEPQSLVANAGPDRTVQTTEEVTFKAAPQPGGAQAKYSWDFDEQVGGIGEDEIGPEVLTTFSVPGEYWITLTVTSPIGDRVPQVDRVQVTVKGEPGEA